MSPAPPLHDSGVFRRIVSRPIGVMVILVSLVVLGLIAYRGLPLQLLPGGIQGNRFSVWVNHPGSSANENEDKVARILEEEFRTLPDIDNLWSRASDGSASVRVAFKSQGDLELAKAELRDRIERARPRLPETIERIGVWSNDDGEPPIVVFILMVDPEMDDPSFLIEQVVQRRLEAVDGVSKVDIWGMLDDSIRILLDEDKVAAARMDIGALIQRLNADNFSKPLGQIQVGRQELLLRSDMRFDDLQEIRDYPIGNGQTIGDVAEVIRAKSVRDWLSRVDGKPAYYGMVQRESNANVVSTSQNIQKALDEIENDPRIAGRVSSATLFNQGDMIESSLASLRNTAIWGGVLAAIVLLVFLKRLRMTLCVALSIPVSILLALVYEYFTGGTFNILTMTGLTLALGMLVDNSVVVIENIARLRAMGYSPLRAAAYGARDVGLAITMATITTLVVFLPLVFTIEDPMMRAFLSAMTRPLSLALLSSLLVALFFLPVLALLADHDRPAWMQKPVAGLAWLASRPARALAWGLGGLRAAGRGLLAVAHTLSRFTSRMLAPVRVLLVLGIVVGAYFGYRAAQPTTEWGSQLRAMGLSAPPGVSPTPWILAGFVGVLLAWFGLPAWSRQPARRAPGGALVPEGTSVLAWVQEGNQKLLRWTMRHRLLASLLAMLSLATIAIPMSGIQMTSFGQDEDMGEVTIRVSLEDNFTLYQASQEIKRYERYFESRKEELDFDHYSARFRSTRGRLGLHFELGRKTREEIDALRLQLQREMPRFAGHQLYFGGEQTMGDASKQTVQFELRGSNSAELERLGAEAVQILQGVPGLTDVESPLEQAPEQVRLILDRESGFQYGATSQATLQNVSWALRGAQLPRFQEEGREVPMYIEYDQEKLAGLDTLRNLNVWTGEGAVALATYGQLDFQPGSKEIWRWNGQTTFTINARLTDPNRKVEVQQAGYDALENLEMPRGYTLGRDTSAFFQRDEQMGQMKNALLLSMVLILIVMGILFESLLLPFAIMMTIPFAILGALWTLYFLHPAMDSMGWIGFILLVGVVVNNGIVLLDKIHRMRTEEGLDRDAAVLAGTKARVRPILMTAMTTVFGLLPITLSPYDGKGIDYRALATCVAGGLAISTFFTLWVVPLAYTYLDDMRQRGIETFLRALGRQPAKESRPGPVAQPGLALDREPGA